MCDLLIDSPIIKVNGIGLVINVRTLSSGRVSVGNKYIFKYEDMFEYIVEIKSIETHFEDIFLDVDIGSVIPINIKVYNNKNEQVIKKYMYDIIQPSCVLYISKSV